ncbi:hypothetical protein FSP39_006094 [Pinctada imbricata]|uniref:VLRF1 domain-containing protein n=1 Tax=Pinctada imbricata TaxID=66713 RepID=A0AA89C6Q6_PINIB|nr:hypothetical protein FSP39_006094 [Pinctada imbricata]
METRSRSSVIDGLQSPNKKMQKRQSKKYSTVLLYDTGNALAKLNGLTIAACNPTSDQSHLKSTKQQDKDEPSGITTDVITHVPDRKSCNTCSVEFEHRSEQKEHFKSDWHRYNLQQKIKGRNSVTAERFEEILGSVSSISGSESDSEDEDVTVINKMLTRPLLTAPDTTDSSAYSSNESDVETSRAMEEQGRKYPKIFFRNADGDVISVYRCVVQHKKNPASSHQELVSMVAGIPQKVRWVVLMASGGHFAGAVFDRDKVVAQKTFHRYVVRAKRGTAQGSRDSQGNAPKSAGASLRRYNEAALKEDIQNLITSWSEHMANCDLIFLRAPSFNKKIFFSGKTPLLRKDDERIRMIPFPTKRPTHNEVRRVHQMLASIECYGEELEIQDHVPLTPPLTFNPDKGHLEVIPQDQQTSSRPRKFSGRSRTSPLVTENNDGNVESKDTETGKIPQESTFSADSTPSSTASTGSESEMLETLQSISTSHLKEFEFSKKPKRKKKTRKRRLSKHQIDPESDVYAEEKYHLKNALYTAVKVGDIETLQNLVAIFTVNQVTEATPTNESFSIFGGDERMRPSINIAIANNNVESLETPTPTQEVNVIDGSSANEIASFADIETPTEDSNVLSLRSQSHSSQQLNDLNERQIDLVSNVSENESNNSENKVHEQNNLQTPCEINANSSTTQNIDEKRLPLNDLEKTETNNVSMEVTSPVVTMEILNEPIGDNEKTLLHVACKEGHRKIVKILLESGADPAIKDKFGSPPYVSTNDKEVRNEFRRFMARFPDRYDYKTAQVPSPLTPEMELERKQKDADRKKAQKKAKQERDKIKRAEEAVKEAEEREKKRFLALSDREKRALAAEKRLLREKEEKGEAKPVTSRCFQCGSDMTGKVPFEYYEFRFCASKCLKEHRMSVKKS